MKNRLEKGMIEAFNWSLIIPFVVGIKMLQSVKFGFSFHESGEILKT